MYNRLENARERPKQFVSHFCIFFCFPTLQMRWDIPLCPQPPNSVALRVDVFHSQMYHGVGYWVASERGALCCSASGLFAFSQAQLQAWEDTCTSHEGSEAVCYSKSSRSQCDSVVGNRGHCLTSWVSNFSHCTSVPAGNVLERQILGPAQTPWTKGSRFSGNAHCEPCSRFRSLWRCKDGSCLQKCRRLHFLFFSLLAFLLKSDK